MIAAVASGFALALAAPWIVRRAPAHAGWMLALAPAAMTAYLAAQVPAVVAGSIATAATAWIPTLGIALSFRLDGLSLLFGLLITGVGAVVTVYAGGYLAGHPQLGRFFASLFLFMASMLGLVLADDLIAMFVFWELTSVSSYLLIGFDHDRAEARSAALQALLVTAGGGLVLLAGLLLLGQVGGTFAVSALIAHAEAVRGHVLYLPVLVLILVGAFTKSAQVPFHFWLPSAMEAPTPVSAYLHSATMVKAGVYLLARLAPVLGGTTVWTALVLPVGAATMLVGALLALRQTDLKRILAYSTVSALGALTALIGAGTPAAVEAAMVFLLAHALYKGALFLVAGAVDHETGMRDVSRVGGLRRAMPLTAAAAGLAALSMAGLPPALGFLAKELLYEAVWPGPGGAAWALGVVVVASAALVAVAGIAGVEPFAGPAHPTPRTPHEAPPSLLVGPALLAGLGLAVGLAPVWTAQPLVASAAGATLGAPVTLALKLWHGFTPALGLSVLTVLAGATLYATRSVLRRDAAWLDRAGRLGPAAWYDWAMRALLAAARDQTRLLQSGYLRTYLLVVVGTTVAVTGYALATRVGVRLPTALGDVRSYEWVLAAAILLAALGAVRAPSRLAAVAALGAVGYGIAVVFILYGAPDLAMTQFAVETLTVILFVLVLYRMPRFARYSGTAARVRDALVATAAGGLMTLLLLAATGFSLERRVSAYYAESSVPLAGGRNVVNVILVDFRALDTLGEITVLAIAGVGVYALMRLRARTR
ncbi:MAG: putative monovalent cation/H+ antiporter subunit A [Armatimonadota bacterium]|nr:putative monovalent cation/H+ antiporter subunit A [Armatimonadota bacterium]